jgi:hypothetical protein
VGLELFCGCEVELAGDHEPWRSVVMLSFQLERLGHVLTGLGCCESPTFYFGYVWLSPERRVGIERWPPASPDALPKARGILLRTRWRGEAMKRALPVMMSGLPLPTSNDHR